MVFGGFGQVGSHTNNFENFEGACSQALIGTYLFSEPYSRKDPLAARTPTRQATAYQRYRRWGARLGAPHVAGQGALSTAESCARARACLPENCGLVFLSSDAGAVLSLFAFRDSAPTTPNTATIVDLRVSVTSGSEALPTGPDLVLAWAHICRQQAHTVTTRTFIRPKFCTPGG